jgi:hypothetical protein
MGEIPSVDRRALVLKWFGDIDQRVIAYNGEAAHSPRMSMSSKERDGVVRVYWRM